MKLLPITVVAISLTALSACQPTPKFPIRAGESYTVTSANLSYCADEADKFYPRDLRTISGGGYTTPMSTQCYRTYGGGASCSTTGGTYIAPYSYNTDVNYAKRVAAYHSCLEKRGYELKTIKECSGDRAEIYEEIMRAERKQGVYSSNTCSITVEGDYMIRW
jgi:hypothetical protein